VTILRVGQDKNQIREKTKIPADFSAGKFIIN